MLLQNKHQLQLIEESFAKITPMAEEFAATFYVNLFANYPAAKPLFTNTAMKAQEEKLLHSLMLVMENLHETDTLNECLRGLGASHVQYGALPEHYPLVGNSLLKTFEQYLGDNWTPEIKQAWVDAYNMIAEIMLEGADYSQEEVLLPLSREAKTNLSKGKATVPEESAQTTETVLGKGEKSLLAVVAGGILTVIVIALLL